MNLPADYYERVYAGILGKIIGVYLGRPIEGWTYAQIMSQIGEVRYYVPVIRWHWTGLRKRANWRRPGDSGRHSVRLNLEDVC